MTSASIISSLADLAEVAYIDFEDIKSTGLANKDLSDKLTTT